MNLGNKISKLRKENNLSQEQLGNIINVTRQTISNWELGETYPNIEQLKALAHIFKISLDDLVDNKSDTTPKAQKKIKFSKIIIISSYLLVLTGIISFGVYWYTKKDFTNYYTNDFNCYVKNDWYDGMAYFELENKNDDTFTIRAFEENKPVYQKNTDDISKAYSLLNELKKSVIAKGGICKPNKN